MADCATRLAEAEAALHSLLTGAKAVEVEDDSGFRVRYQQTNISALEAYVNRLKAECGASGAADDTLVRRPLLVRF